MFDEGTEIVKGMVVVHDEGLRYRVDRLLQSTNGYEITKKLGGMTVDYTQLDAGTYPVGTGWSKDEAEFRKYFTPTELVTISSTDS